METQIGKVAGVIWDILQEKGEVSLSQLPKLVAEKDTIVYQGLGWLAREGKISYRADKNRTFVDLKK
ncbi:MAG: winged helix-turn-helix domain-containing protein [bacterium]|nr:winged helix-turn-helix domain-containing protein [bacterium]